MTKQREVTGRTGFDSRRQNSFVCTSAPGIRSTMLCSYVLRYSAKSNHRRAQSLLVRLFLLLAVSLVGLLHGEQNSSIPMTDPSHEK